MSTEQLKEGASLKELREYAWRYFNVHAEQRMKTFNFYVVLCAALIAGMVSSATGNLNTAAPGFLAILLGFLSFIFWKLDLRTRQLLKHGESALKRVEEQICARVESGRPDVLQLFLYEEQMTKALPRLPFDSSEADATLTWWPTRAHFSYTTCFNAVFFVFGFGGVVVGCLLLVWAC